MMTTAAAELEAESVASSPRSEHLHVDPSPRLRFMCSFGGRILPRPHDNQLRYVGGDTRIVALHRSSSFSSLLLRLSKLSGSSNITVKYQLPNEDLDALISVTSDEDVENMMEEYDRVAQNQNPRLARLRLFLFPKEEEECSRTNSISSLLDGSANRESWFVDALNNNNTVNVHVNGLLSRLERNRSEASSMLSEVPDYLFGLENSDDTRELQPPRSKFRPPLNDTVSCSDPGSPAPPSSSPFCSTSSALNVPNLPPVKTKPDNPDHNHNKNNNNYNYNHNYSNNSVPVVVDTKENQVEGVQIGNSGGQIHNYLPENVVSGHTVQPVPFYYIPGPVPVQHGQVPVQPVTIQGGYVQQYPAAAVPGQQVPVGYRHVVAGSGGGVYGGGMRPVVGGVNPYEAATAARIVPEGVRQYQAIPTGGGAVFPTGSESQRVGAEYGPGRGPMWND